MTADLFLRIVFRGTKNCEGLFEAIGANRSNVMKENSVFSANRSARDAAIRNANGWDNPGSSGSCRLFLHFLGKIGPKNVWENAWKSQTSFFQTSAAF